MASVAHLHTSCSLMQPHARLDPSSLSGCKLSAIDWGHAVCTDMFDLKGKKQMMSTQSWLRHQWSSPSDIFSILLLLGGDVVQRSIAQLCGHALVPVSFSFGWMSYAVSALLSAVGENRLMPNPDFECIVINGKTGYVRNNKSWILARILRDYEYWRDTGIDTTMASELARLEKEEKEKAKGEYREAKAVRLGLCVSVYRAVEISGIPKPDPLYWTGYGVVLVQLAISIIPWAIYADRQWLTFMVTAVGTVLAFLSAALPQWKEEKFKVRTQDPGKVVILTQGNGAQHAIAIACDAINGLDLEALASPYRDLKSQTFTRLCSCLLAIAWLCLLICVTGYSGSTWFLLANGLLGIFHNIIVAGCPRNPSAYGMNLVYEKTFTARKLMAVLADLEDYKPRLGASLVPTFFPGELLNREVKFWEYAERRAKAFEGDAKTAKKAKTIPLPWKMPPLEGDQEAKDIPLTLVYGTRVPNAVTSV